MLSKGVESFSSPCFSFNVGCPALTIVLYILTSMAAAPNDEMKTSHLTGKLSCVSRNLLCIRLINTKKCGLHLAARTRPYRTRMEHSGTSFRK